MDAYRFEVLTPEKQMFSSEVHKGIVPGEEGEITVLPSHTPMVSLLGPGLIHLEEGSSGVDFFIRKGFLEVTASSAVVFSEDAVRVSSENRSIFEEHLERARREVSAPSLAEADPVLARLIGCLEGICASLSKSAS